MRWRSNPMRDWASTIRRFMPIIDVLLILLAFRMAYSLRYDLQLLKSVEDAYLEPGNFLEYVPYALIYGVWMLVTWPVASLYREQRGRTWFEEVYTLANGATNATVLVMALIFLLRPLVVSRLMIIEATVLVVFWLSVFRLIYRAVRQSLRTQGIGVERVLVVGAGDTGRAVLSAIIARPDLGYVPIGYLDDRPERGLVNMGRVRGLGELNQLGGLLTDHAADLVIITLPWNARQQIMELVALCEQYGVPTRIVPDLFQLNMSQVSIENLEGIPLLVLPPDNRLDRPRHLAKRIIDLTLIILSLPITLPLALIVALAIKLDSPGPILFSHRRVGKDGYEFDMFKFRSMRDKADHMRNQPTPQTGPAPKRPKWEKNPRITRLGKWIR